MHAPLLISLRAGNKMAIENEELAAVMRARGLNPNIMRLIQAYLPGGWQNIIVYDEEAVDEAILVLSRVIGEDSPEYVRNMFDEMKVYHQRRRQEGRTIRGICGGDS